MEIRPEEDKKVNELSCKVLQRAGGRMFIPCALLKLNGRPVFLYFTECRQSLKVMLPDLSAAAYIKILRQIFQEIQEIRASGFLFPADIEASLSCIFPDLVSGDVQFIYEPLEGHKYRSEAEFVSCLKRELSAGFNTLNMAEKQNFGEIKKVLDDPLSTEEQLLAAFNGKAEAAGGSFFLNRKGGKEALKIREPVCVLGKKVKAADLVIRENPMISRRHCRIENKQEHWFVTDLGSRNGTFINFRRLETGIPLEIRDGDILRLADEDFYVNMGNNRHDQTCDRRSG